MTVDGLREQLDELLVRNPLGIRQILAEHVEDRGKCKVCKAGAGVHQTFPCTLRQAALRARGLSAS